eukprot:GAHX01002203.1.p1 GENE.GAHX01002203.1~~GAHX01002203.1.p1  ORF type:complete len:475 (-),score=37.26 GAHX01002203.1:685-2109(-)
MFKLITQWEAMDTTPLLLQRNSVEVYNEHKKYKYMTSFIYRIRKQASTTLKNEELSETNFTRILSSYRPIDIFQSSCISQQKTPEGILNLLSSEYLLQQIPNNSLLALDATFIPGLDKFKLIIIGYVTSTNKFRLLTFSLVKHETALTYSWILKALRNALSRIHGPSFAVSCILADNAAAITSAIDIVFDDIVRLNCWFHTSRNIFKNIPKNESNLNVGIKSDLIFLQRAFSKSIFEKALDSFYKVWNNFTFFRDFLIRFKANSIDSNRNWYRGCNIHYSSSNNFLEGFNSTIKRNYFQGTEKSIHSILKSVSTIIEDKGRQYFNDKRLTKSAYSRNYERAELSRIQMIGPMDGYYIYYYEEAHGGCSSNDSNTVTEHSSERTLQTHQKVVNNTRTFSVQRLKELITSVKPFSGFHEYKDFMGLIFIGKRILSTSTWEDYYCTCFSFFKVKRCKHIYTLGSHILEEENLEYFFE